MMRNLIDRIASESGYPRKSYHGPSAPYDPDYVPSAPSVFGHNKNVHRALDTQTIVDEILSYVPHTLENSQGLYGESGDDVLACYKSFFHHQENWGIYFDVARMFDYVTHNSFGDDSSMILKVLHHERFHFLVEFLGAFLEPVTSGLVGNQIYDSYQRVNGSSPRLVEEAMCNAYALTRPYKSVNLRLKPKQIVSELAKICDKAPAGYRDYWQVCDPHGVPGSLAPHRQQISKDWFNNSVAIFFDGMVQSRTMIFTAFMNQVVVGSALHVRSLLLSEREFSRIPTYLVYPWSPQQGGMQFYTPKIKLARFYRFLESKYGVVYSEGSKHGKLHQPSTGKKRVGWKRKGSKADLLPYHIKQAATWLELPPDNLAKELEAF